MQSLHSTARALVTRMSLVALAIAASRFVISIPPEPGQASLTVMVYALTAVTALLVFAPLRETTVAGRFAWPAGAALLFAVAVGIDPVTRDLAAALPVLSAVVFLLGSSLAVVVTRVTASTVAALFLVAAFSPVWAGPLMELAGNPAWMNHLVVCTSPFTVFAIALDVDYLRTAWFYEHSTLGAMRYSYPSLLNTLVALAALPIFELARRVLRRAPITPVQHPKEA